MGRIVHQFVFCEDKAITPEVIQKAVDQQAEL